MAAIESEVDGLVYAIRQGIAIRGIYAVLDDRLDLICGPGTLENINSWEVTQKIAEFAAAHGWLATRYHAGFVFVVDQVIVPPISN